MEAASFPTPAGADLADPEFTESVLREENPERRRELIAGALLAFFVRTDSLPQGAEVDTPTTLESLTAVELNAVLEARLGVELGLPELRGAVTADQLADDIAGLLGNGSAPGAGAVLVADDDGRFEPFGLTDLQQAYLLGRGGFFALGNVPAAFYAEIDADSLDVDRLERAWNTVVARHDMLRTVFTDDGRQQALADVPIYRFARHDVRNTQNTEREAHLTALREEIAGRVREPAQWPLFEIATTRLDDEHTRIHIAIDLLIADAPGIRQLLSEWMASDAGREPGPAPRVSFRDYVRALEGVEETETFARARDYWLARLPELPPAPELPLHTAPETLPAARFTSRSLALTPEQWTSLRQRALRNGLTPSMVLCWAYAATLRTWSANDTFTLNVTVNERLPLHPDIDHVVGEYTSQVLVAVETNEDACVRDRITTLQDRFWTDFKHRAFSGVRVLRELARSEDGTRTTMPFVFDAVLGQDLDQADLPAWFRDVPYVSATAPQVSLECQAFELGGTLRVNWAVVEELFPPGLIDAAFAAFGALLGRLADDEDLWNTTDLGLVVPDELAARQEANATERALHQGLLHELGGTLRSRGDAPAVITPDRVIGYAELDQRAARIARRLRDLGACPNSLVGVVMHKGWEQSVAALAVLQSGAAYLPVDAAWPIERLHHILDRGRCRIVLTQSELRDTLEWPADITVLAVDDDTTWIDVDDTPLEPMATPSDLAYVIFTSGSTGEPKGVMIDHRGAVNTIVDINERFGVTAADRVFGLSSLSFDLSVWDIFGTFATGGTLVLPAANANRDPEVWSDLVRRHGVTVWNTVPALMEMLAEHVGARGEALQSLRLVMMSGDWIPLSLPDRIRTIAPDAELISLGGATEASIWSIYHPIGELDPTWPSIPYGRPLANQTFHILDNNLQPVPTWVPGELFIGGAGVAHGYWNDPTRTAERFLTHPATGERLYRTGDLGRYHPDGTIEFLGRNDHQVKINGYRIELGEIEAKLTTHPNVKDTVVTTTDNHLTAYVTRAESAPDDPDQLVGSLRAALAVALPDYMIPRNFVLLDTLPLSANGKVDRGALPAPLPQPTGGSPSRGDADPVGAQGSEPRNDMERRLRDIWKEVLGLEAVSVHDDFGQLGGDSLLALRVISRAAEAGLELTPRQFFEHPTIAGLAGVATLAVPRPAEEQPTEVIGDVPLLPAQAMLLAGLDATVARHHNYALFFELDEPLNKVALRVALRTLISRHDSLRTGFVHGPKGWRQHVATVDEVSVVPMEWLDLGDMPAEEQGRTIEELAEQAQRSFDLAEPPLLRVLYFDRGRDRKPELLLVAHWLVVDNFSLRIVLGDLLAAHAQIAEYGHAELPAPGTPAAVWAEQVARQTEQTGVTSQPPFERARHGTARDAVTLVEVLDSRATDRLREQTNSSVVLGDVILAALARAARATGLGESIRVDVDGHGRGAVLPGVASPIDLSRTVGRLSVRNQLEVPALQDPVRAAKTVAAVRAALPNGGLDDAVTAYGTTAVADGLSAPAPEFAFNYLGTVDELYAITGLRPSGHRPGPLVHPETPLRHRFELLCGTVEGELLIGLTCPGIDQPEAEHLLKNFMAELRGVEAAVERPAAANGRDTRGAALADTFRRWLSPAAAD